ncbi:cation transporter [Candidatus Woesearchaeota archaeon]|nr:cation transporter [Candidatus Woesearchaeota archaeon]
MWSQRFEMKQKIYCPDIMCESCNKVIERALAKLQGIQSYIFREDSVDVEFDESLIKVEQIMGAIREKGYRASLEPLGKKRIKERAKEFLHDKQKYQIEYQMLRNITVTFLLLLVLDALFIYYKGRTEPTAFSNYGWWLLYLTVAVVTVAGAIWHFKAYKAQYTCMVGMMIGMTLGMQTGIMFGAILGATNGFFVGALVGMIMGVGVGAYCGSCCGVMGIMEGMMAGVMGGTMGPMITLMMFNDRVLWFMPLFMFFNVAILIGLSYMIFEEVVEGNNEVVRKPWGLAVFLGGCGIVLAVLLLIILLTPPSIFVA